MSIRSSRSSSSIPASSLEPFLAEPPAMASPASRPFASSASSSLLLSSLLCSLRILRALTTSSTAWRTNRSYDSVDCITSAHSSRLASTSARLPTSVAKPQSSRWATARFDTMSFGVEREFRKDDGKSIVR